MDFKSQEFSDYLLDAAARVLIPARIMRDLCNGNKKLMEKYLGMREDFITDLFFLACLHMDGKNRTSEYMDDSAFAHTQQYLEESINAIDDAKKGMEKIFSCNKKGCGCARRIISWQEDEKESHDA